MNRAELAVVLIVGLALLVGAAMRLFSSKLRFPYTIGMLVLGIAGGLALRRATEAPAGSFVGLVTLGTQVTPDLIIFVFLPALVFESAFAIDVGSFRKNLGAVTLLAAPALVLSTFMVGAMMVYGTASTWAWGWPAALVFGALISATDPVAVVAIFSELGVSKRLGVLVEGESLLNDGTSIVVFSLVLELLTGRVASLSATDALVRFAVVVSGGVAVGLVLAFVLSWWIERMFNDPLSEITLTLVLAYASMIVAEGLLHVSGVMAVVTAGLWMSATGKRKISPEIQEFLHRFWQMLGYVANTLIFVLVGVVIGRELHSATLGDLALVGAVYAGVMVIRAVLTFAFRPLCDRLSEGMSHADSLVVVWGGLRGAVSLALALIVAQNPAVPAELRHQILLATAGVVLLTILVNGTTISRVLAALGFDRPPPSEQLANLTARSLVLEGVARQIDEVSKSRDLRTVDWTEVSRRLGARREAVEAELGRVRDELAQGPASERAAGHWRKILAVERQAYWESFAAGTLGSQAVRLLTAEIDRQLDRMGRGDLAPPLDRAPAITGGVAWLFGRGAMGFEAVALRYDLWRAEAHAADVVLARLDAIKGCEAATLDDVRETYRRYLRVAKERLEDLRTNLPEMARAVETRLARRIELNLEREGFVRLMEHGVLDHQQAHAELHRVEHDMSDLRNFAERVQIPETADLVAKTPLFQALSREALAELAEITEEMVVPPGDYLFRQGEGGDSLFVIARGAVHVLVTAGAEEALVDVLGGGDVVGEMALLTGEPRTASVRAATSVTLGRIGRQAFTHLLEAAPQLEAAVWRAFVRRIFDNHVRGERRYRHLDHDARLEWIERARIVRQEADEKHEVTAGTTAVFVVTGRVRVGEVLVNGPRLLDVEPGVVITAAERSRVALLPPADSTGSAERHSLGTAVVREALDR